MMNHNVTIKYMPMVRGHMNDIYYQQVQFPQLPNNNNPLPQYGENSDFIKQMAEVSPFTFADEITNSISSICKDTKTMDSPVEYLKIFVQDIQFNDPKEIRIQVAYILTLMDKTGIYTDVFKDAGGNYKYDDIFREHLFPVDPTNGSVDFGYIKSINRIFHNWYVRIPDDQEMLLNLIYKYVSKSPSPRKIYNFLPFISLVLNSEIESNLYSIFCNSDLFKLIVNSAFNDNEIVLFNIFRNFISLRPLAAFKSYQELLLQNSDLPVFSNFYSKDIYRVDIANCIKIAFEDLLKKENAKQVDQDMYIVFDHIDQIIALCDSDEKANQLLPLYSGIHEMFAFKADVYDYIMKETPIFSNLARVSLRTSQLFDQYIQLLTRMYLKHEDFDEYISFTYKIYDILKQYTCVQRPDLTSLEAFALLAQPKDGASLPIQNIKAIELLLELLPRMLDKEEPVLDFFRTEAQSENNIVQLKYAKFPELILKRLTQIHLGSLESVVNKYLELFEIIGYCIFDNSSFYQVIETLKNSDFPYANRVIVIVQKLLLKSISEIKEERRSKYPLIYDVLQTRNSLNYLIPLLDHSTENLDETRDFLLTVLQIFKTMVHSMKRSTVIFISIDFFPLMSSFLLQCNERILNKAFMEELFSFYQALDDFKEMRYQMAQYIIFNYDFLFRNRLVKSYVVLQLLTKVVNSEHPDAFDYSILNSIILKTYEYFDKESEESNKAFELLLIMTRNCLNNIKKLELASSDKSVFRSVRNSYIVSLTKIMMNRTTTYLIVQFLKIIHDILYSHYEDLYEHVRDDQVLNKLVALLGTPAIQKVPTKGGFTEQIVNTSTEGLICVFNILHKLRNDIDIHKIMYQCAIIINGTEDIAKEFVQVIFEKFFHVENEKSSNPTIYFNINYLPLLTASCEVLIESDQDMKEFVKKEICEKITGNITQYTREFHQIVQLPCWYQWLNELFCLVYDHTSDDYKFIANPFAFLFEIDFTEKNMEQINKYFYYLYNAEFANAPAMQFYIISALLFGNQVTPDEIISIFQITFNYLLFNKKVEFDPKGRVTCKYELREITPSIIEQEKSAVTQLLSFTLDAANLSNCNIKIGCSLEANILIACSILVSLFFKQKPEEYSKFAHSIDQSLKNIDSDTARFSFAYLLAGDIGNHNTSLTKGIDDSIAPLVEDIKTKSQLNSEKLAQIKCQYNEKLADNLRAAQAQFLLSIDDIIKLTKKDKFDCLGFDDNEDNSETETLSMSVTVTLLDQNDTDKTNRNNRIFLLNQQHRWRNELRRVIRLKKNFLDNLHNIPGPWFLPNEAITRKFKAFPFISKKGQRVLVKINNDFNDHHDASENTPRLTPTNEIQENVENRCLYYQEVEEKDEFYLTMNEYQVGLRTPEASYSQILRFTEDAISLTSETFEEEKCERVLISFSDIAFILNRQVAFENRACEIFLDAYASYYLTFANKEERDQFYDNIDSIITSNETISQKRKDFLSTSNKFDLFSALREELRSIHQGKDQPGKDLVSILNLDSLWQTRVLTNFEYVYYLNILSGRSFNDVNKYPIIPQLIKENMKTSIELTEESIYRDLRLPILKLDPTKFHALVNNLDKVDDQSLKILTFSGYPSNSFTPITYMVRTEPFTTSQINHQQSNGFPVFLEPNRQFFSIKLMFYSLYTGNSREEAIPEFCTFPYIFKNENHFNLGIRDGHPIDDVILPNWANNSPYIYTAINRIAFESEYVSSNLNHWIDLYFSDGRGYCKDDIEKTDAPEPQGVIDVSQEAIEHYELVNPKIIKPASNKVYQMYQNTAYPEKDNKGQEPFSEEIGVLPEILFSKKHVKREPLPVLNQNQQLTAYQFKPECLAIIKEVAYCHDSYIVDLRNYVPKVTNPAVFQVDKNVHGELECVIRNKKQNHKYNGNGLGEKFAIAFFNTKHDHHVIALDLYTHKYQAVCESESIIKAVASIGNRYIVTGGSDCSLNLYKVVVKPPKQSTGLISFLLKPFTSSQCDYEFKFVSSSGFHSSGIVAIGGCYQNGLIVSLDKKNILIFETMTANPIFINHFDLSKLKMTDPDDDENNEVYMNTKIIVLKSGIVVVALKKRVIFFDSHGVLIHQWKLPSDITNIKNYYGRDTREQLIVSTKDSVSLFDVTSFTDLGPIEGNMQYFSPIHGTNTMIVGQNKEFKIVEFGKH